MSETVILDPMSASELREENERLVTENKRLREIITDNLNIEVLRGE